jgi:tetratricopeptide (TPR) repeat protein
MGLALAQQGDVESARGAFLTCMALGDPEWSPRSAAMLGEILWGHGNAEAAEPILRRAVESSHPEWSAAAGVTLGVVLAHRGDHAGAERAYQAVIAAGHRPHAALAWFNLGTLHQHRRDWGAAVAAYRQAMATEDVEVGPKAAVNLGFVLFSEVGDAAGAEEAFATAIASRHPEQAPLAARNLEALRALQGSGAPTIVVDDAVNVSTGRGRGGLKWRFWKKA